MNNFKSKILIFAIIFVPITISLGLWQIERANEKKAIISNYDKLLVSSPIALQKEQPLENWQPIETVGALAWVPILIAVACVPAPILTHSPI